jgi:hypothetical protein
VTKGAAKATEQASLEPRKRWKAVFAGMAGIAAGGMIFAFQSGCTTAKHVERAAPLSYALPEGLHAEAQYRPGVDPFQYPLIEVFLHNRTGKPIEWKRAFLNGTEIRMLTDGVVWFQFYPTEKAAPNQTVELQINLRSNPMTPQTVEAET